MADTAHESHKPIERDISTPGAAERVSGRIRVLVVLGLITFVGANLRSVLLSVPPILPLIQRDLHLSYTATGLLTSLPVLVMGGFALPAGILAGRFGARAMVALGLALLAGAALLRMLWPQILPLYLLTFALSLGVALSQTAMPVLMRQWFPTRIGLAAALFSDGLIFGEVLGAALTVRIMLDVFGPDAWPATFAFWSVPVFIALALWLWLAPPAPATVSRRAPLDEADSQTARRPRVSALHLGIMLGSGSLIFFGMNAWIPPYNAALLGSQAPGATAIALAVLNTAQVPVSLTLTAFAQRLAGRRWPFIIAGCVCLAAVIGWISTPAALQPLWAGLLGGASSFVFVLGIALPALLADRATVARLSGITLMLSYGVAFVGPLLGGSLWDLFGHPQLAFAPVVAAGCMLIALGALLPPRSAFGLDSHRSLSLDLPTAE